MPRVVLGSLLFNHADHVREAIDSILGQTFSDFALVLVDDDSSDSTPEIAREYPARDRRVFYSRNTERLGLVGNSRRAFQIALQRHPEAEYFAWTSDHDLWHPRWLQELVDALDANPDVVLAYPLNRRIGSGGDLLRRKPWVFDTFGVTSRWARLRMGIRRMRAGNMVYGLFRVNALTRAGVYRRIVIPDRLLIAELSLYGQFKQVADVLWFRRWYGRVFSLSRQRASFFPGRRPLYAFCPWWIAHAASLMHTLTIRGDGRPEVSRGTGLLVGAQYLVLAGAVHAWQRLRELRAWCAGLVSKTRVARIRRGMARLGFEAVRRPGLMFLRSMRAIPVVRNRVIPVLLKEELAGIPAADAVDAVRKELQRLQNTTEPIVVGPWVGEVGFELLYWIPFLNRVLREYQLDRRRLIVISRGGGRRWYRHLTSEYVDVFDLFTLDEYRQANEARWDKAGHQKQYRVEQMDRDIVERAKQKVSLHHVELLHPSLMYRILRYYWFEKAGRGLLDRHTEYRRLAPVEPTPVLRDLPAKYVAVRFYFRPSFPDTPENRRFAANVIRSLSEEVPVVLLNTGLRLDDHEDVDVPGKNVYRVDELMRLDQNLEIQTEIISRAHAFVGTYGGLAYLGPFYGVPSISFYSTEEELVPAHLDVSWRLGRAMGVPVTTLHTKMAGLLRGVL